MLRPDHDFCKYYYNAFGLRALSSYVALPLIDLRDLSLEKGRDVPPERAQFLWQHRPFLAFSMLLRDPESTNGYSVTIAMEDETFAGFCQPANPSPLFGSPGSWLDLRAMRERYKRLLAASDQQFKEDQFARFTADELLIALDIIDTSDVYLVVEERQSEPGAKMRARLKPWVLDCPRRIVLMDISKMRRRVVSPPLGGTHASPVPHPRKGHWCDLRSECFKHKRGQRIYRKPTYVGDKEWVDAGVTYKVLPPRIVDDSKGHEPQSAPSSCGAGDTGGGASAAPGQRAEDLPGAGPVGADVLLQAEAAQVVTE